MSGQSALDLLKRVIDHLPVRLSLLLVVLLGVYGFMRTAARIAPLEAAVIEQSQLLRYLACVDRRGGPSPDIRKDCADDHLSESLKAILGGHP
jgi:hypothetical protein